MVHAVGDAGWVAWTNGVDATVAGKLDSMVASSTYARAVAAAVGRYRCGIGASITTLILNGAVGGLFTVVNPQSFDQITAEVTVAGGAGSLVRLAIFDVDPAAGTVGSLVLDAGTIDGTVVAVQQLTINVALPSGTYLLAATIQGVVSPYPTLRHLVSPIGLSGALNPTSTVPIGGWYVSPAPTGAWPTTCTWTPDIQKIPLINLRRSA